MTLDGVPDDALTCLFGDCDWRVVSLLDPGGGAPVDYTDDYVYWQRR